MSDALDLLNFVAYNPSAVRKFGIYEAYRIRNAKERRRQQEALKRLQQKQLILVDRTAQQYRVALTEKGAAEVFRLKVLNSDLFENDRVCMVVFDIPERHETLRRSLRRFLGSAGFVPIQRSVWISPFNAGKALRTLFRTSEVGKWVKIFTAEEFR